MTSRAGGNTNARLVQVHQNVLPVDVLKRDVRRVWQTFGTIRSAVETRVRNGCEDLVFEPIPQTFDQIVTIIVECELAGGAETDDVGNSRGSGATSFLLCAA